MPKLSAYSAIGILILLFDLTVTENNLNPKRNISLLNLQKERIARDSLNKFWKRRLLHKNEVIVETVGSLNNTSRFANNQIAKDTNFNEEFENVMENIKRWTLMDDNGPAIIEENLDNKNGQDFADHVRVKRNEPTNDSIVRHQLNFARIFDSFPQNFSNKVDARNVYSDSMFELEGSYVNSDHVNRSNALPATITDNISHSRHKREILSKNRQRDKRMKRNIKHSKHRVGAENKKKKHDASKTSRRPAVKKANNSKKTSKKTKIVPAKTTGESRMKKRESEKHGLNTDLARISNTDFDKREEDTVALPFVHTGRAELRVRIEKIPRNESSFISNWTDNSIETSTCCSTALLKYDDDDDDKIIQNTTNFEFVPNVDSTEREKVNNLTVEIILKKIDYGNNRRTSDSGNSSFYDGESHSIGSDLSRIKDLENGKYNRVKISAQSLDEDAKSRAKRNQEITSRHYPSDRNTMIRSKEFENGQETSIEDIKHERKKLKSRDNRAVKSIEEIKELAEKLVVKVNELQMYVNNRTTKPYEITTGICVDKNVTVVEETPSRISSKKKRTAKVSESDLVDNRRYFANIHGDGSVTLAGTKANAFGGSRFARRENPIQRMKSRRKWGRWMDWSSCSVTCGKGRQIRWRHCLRDCDEAETEMEEKACQLPACPPGKFLGIF